MAALFAVLIVFLVGVHVMLWHAERMPRSHTNSCRALARRERQHREKRHAPDRAPSGGPRTMTPQSPRDVQLVGDTAEQPARAVHPLVAYDDQVRADFARDLEDCLRRIARHHMRRRPARPRHGNHRLDRTLGLNAPRRVLAADGTRVLRIRTNEMQMGTRHPRQLYRRIDCRRAVSDLWAPTTIVLYISVSRATNHFAHPRRRDGRRRPRRYRRAR